MLELKIKKNVCGNPSARSKCMFVFLTKINTFRKLNIWPGTVKERLSSKSTSFPEARNVAPQKSMIIFLQICPTTFQTAIISLPPWSPSVPWHPKFPVTLNIPEMIACWELIVALWVRTDCSLIIFVYNHATSDLTKMISPYEYINTIATLITRLNQPQNNPSRCKQQHCFLKK